MIAILFEQRNNVSMYQQKGFKMEKVNWTPEQKQAIEEKDANILVAAAARKWKNSSISRKNYPKDINTKNRY